MPASASARQHAHAGHPFLGRPVVRQVVDEELRQGVAELDGVYGRSGLLIRGCRSLAGRLDGHRLHSLVDAWLGPRGLDGDFRSTEARLALRSESLNLVYLLHSLECARDPVGLLSEAARVLEPEGALLLLAFNPLSPFRLRWLGQGLGTYGVHQSARMVRAAGLEVHACRHLGVWWCPGDARSPASRPGLTGLASSYLMLARRRDAALTPLRLERKPIALGATASTG